MIIDATNLIVGRLGTVVAKKALLGETIEIVNSEKAVISGDKTKVFAEYKRRRERGSPLVGPFVPRQPDRFVKRTIRGMLPYKQPKGVTALKNIKCYRSIPEEFEGKKIETIKEANVSKLTKAKHVTVGDICKFLGGKA